MYMAAGMERWLAKAGRPAMHTRVATEKGNTIVLFRVLDVTDLLLPGPGSAFLLGSVGEYSVHPVHN